METRRFPYIAEVLSTKRQLKAKYTESIVEQLQTQILGVLESENGLNEIEQFVTEFIEYATTGEVQKAMEDGTSKKDALNGFMKRVLGSIDK